MSGHWLRDGIRAIKGCLQTRGYRLALALNIALVLSYIGLIAIALMHRLTWMADFTSHYTGGFILREGLGTRLYDLTLQATIQQRLLGGRYLGDGLLPFNRPPHTALLMAPLTLLPLEWAYGIWLGFNLILWAVLLWDLWRTYPDWSRRERAMAALTWTALPSWLRAVALGTFSIWGSFVMWRFTMALQRNREREAGLYLALGSVHPTVTLFPLLALVGGRRWRAVGAWAAAMALIAGLVTLLMGPSIWIGFLNVLRATASARDHPGIDPASMYNLRGALFTLLGPEAWEEIQIAAWAMLGIGIGLTLIAWWKIGPAGGPLLNLHLGWTVLAGLLLSPHLNPQDGLLVGLPALWLYQGMRGTRGSHRAFATIAVLSPAVFFFGEALIGPRVGIRLPILGMLLLGAWNALVLLRKDSASLLSERPQ